MAVSPRILRRSGLLGACALLVGHARIFDFVNDDAFISFRYADNLVRHGELVYNVGERVEGFTNFLWTVLMAGVMALGLDPVPWSKAIGIVFGVATLLVLVRFAGRGDDDPSIWDTLPAWLLAAAPSFACWSTGGLETQLFTFTVTLGWTSYLDEQAGRTRGLPWSGVWFALAAMTRPEGMLFFGLAGLHRLGTLIAVERRLPPARDWQWGAGFAVVFGPYFAWRWGYYGWPLPNTYYVKAGGHSFWGPGLRYFWSWVTVHLLWALPALVFLQPAKPSSRNTRFLWLAGLFVGALCLHVIKVGGDFMGLHRFFVPVMPILAVVAARGLRTLVESLLKTGQSRGRLTMAALFLTAFVGWHVQRVDRAQLEVGSDRGVDSIGWLAMFAGQCAEIGKWLAANAPPDASIATTAAGIIPFYSRLYTLDVLGLNDEWIAHNVKARGSRPGHTKSAPESYVVEKEIDYLIYHPTIAKRRPGQGSAQVKHWRERGYQWETTEVPGLDPPWWGYWRRIHDESAHRASGVH